MDINTVRKTKGLNIIVNINIKNNTGGKMTNLSVSISVELKNKMVDIEEVNWSAVARKAFEEKIKEIEVLKKIASKSKLTEKDVKEISGKINEGMARKFRSM